jgi:hypothetical protein
MFLVKQIKSWHRKFPGKLESPNARSELPEGRKSKTPGIVKPETTKENTRQKRNKQYKGEKTKPGSPSAGSCRRCPTIVLTKKSAPKQPFHSLLFAGLCQIR